MLDVLAGVMILAAVSITVWVLVLLWQVTQGAVSPKLLSRLSGNPKLMAGYFRVARMLGFVSIGIAILAAFELILVLENYPGLTTVWAFAALSIGAYLLSRRCAQAATAAHNSGASTHTRTKCFCTALAEQMGVGPSV